MKATPFDPVTGKFSNFVIEGDIEANTPPGWSWLEGEFSSELQRVQMVVDDFGTQIPTVVDRIPPQPFPDDEWRTWSWIAEAREWRPAWTVKSRDVLKRRERDQLLTSTDWIKQRADEQGETLSPEWLAWRQALRDAPSVPAWPDIDFPPPPAP